MSNEFSGRCDQHCGVTDAVRQSETARMPGWSLPAINASRSVSDVEASTAAVRTRGPASLTRTIEMGWLVVEVGPVPHAATEIANRTTMAIGHVIVTCFTNAVPRHA